MEEYFKPNIDRGKGSRAVKNFETILKPIKNQKCFMCFVGDCLKYIWVSLEHMGDKKEKNREVLCRKGKFGTFYK